jgi:GlpG protein
MIKVLEISIDMDLSLFSRYLWQLGMSHRIFEESGQQQLWVDTNVDAERALDLFEQYRSGCLQLEEHPRQNHGSRPSILDRLRHHFRMYPATLTFVLLAVLSYPITMGLDNGRINDWLHLFTFTDFIINGEHILFVPFGHTMANGEIWRLWTPMLLHFGLIHLVFNMLWLWEIGRRIEILQGTPRVFNLVMITAVFSNVLQSMMTKGVIFGGMSGVVYGLLGYSLVWSHQRPERTFGLPKGIYIFMFAWLALGFVGVIDSFGFGAIANGAHLGGLIAGLGLGFVAVKISKKNQNN